MKKRTPLLIILVLLLVALAAWFGIRARPVSTDNEQVAAAKAALAAIDTLNPIEGTDRNAAAMAQAIADVVSSGVTVRMTGRSHSQIAEDGEITYGNALASGQATFSLSRKGVEVIQVTTISVPAHADPAMCSVKDYGAVGDGKADDTLPIQRAADYARDRQLVLLIPDGNYLITQDVKFYTSVECRGKILIRNSADTPGVFIFWSRPAVDVAADSLSGLSRGSTKLAGLNGYQGGTVVLDSKEILIQRTSSGAYTKMETSEIIGDDGQISPPLDSTYNDPSQLTVTVHPSEAPIAINGLRVASTGKVVANQSLVECYRDNITINNMELVNTGACKASVMNVGVTVRGCRVTLNNPVIKGFSTDDQIGNGYGIMYGKTSFLTINNAHITDCNGHGIAGYHDKEARINGGYFGTSIDDHWGSNMIVDGAVIERDVSYAGTDITIRNCTYVDCVRLLVVRADTPELDGKVVIDNINVRNLANGKLLLGFGYSQSTQGTDYGRILRAPELVSITNVRANLPLAGKFNVLGTADPKPWIANPVDPIKQFHVEDVTTVNNRGKIILGN